EHGIDLIEVEVVALEDGGERRAIIRGGGCRNFGTDVGELIVIGVDPEDDATAIKDGVVGSADGAELVLGHRRQGGGAETGGDLLEVELKLVQLVQGRFQGAGDDLQIPG